MMFEKIDKMIDERFLDGEHITLYDENSIRLDDTIEEMLKNDDTITQYDVSCEEVFDSPGTTIYCLSVAYVENSALEHFTYVVEIY
jgi:hypothetical protein